MTRYDKDNLPVPIEMMGLHRKTALTPMVLIEGPCVVVSREREYPLPEGWKGMLAVDTEGWPYAIALDEYHQTYEPIGTMRVPLR